MNKCTLFLPLVFCLTSCQLIQQPHPEQKNEICLLRVSDTPPPEKDVTAKSKGLEGEIISAVGGFIVNASVKALENYGKKFEASYNKTLRCDEVSAVTTKRYISFQRILTFKTAEERKAFLTKSGHRAEVYDDKNGVEFGLVAMEYQGVLVPSNSNKSLSLRNTSGHLSIPKARRLGGLLKDKPGVSITFIMREAAAGAGTNTSTVIVPVKISEDGSTLVFEGSKEGSDWIQSPASGSYSVQVTVQETGKGKAYADKAAALLKKLGDKGVEKASEAVGG